MMGHFQGMSANMLRMVESQGASIQHGAPESKVWVDLWHVLPETWTELEEPDQEEETCNLHEKSKDGWRHSTPRPQEVVEFPRCNNAGID